METEKTTPRLATIKVRREWPFNRMFPICPISKAIREIAGRKTLKQSDLELLDKTGFDVEVE